MPGLFYYAPAGGRFSAVKQMPSMVKRTGGARASREHAPVMERAGRRDESEMKALRSACSEHARLHFHTLVC